MSPALRDIILLLDRLDSLEIHKLQTIYLPAARRQALASESRTTPVRMPSHDEPTVAVAPDVIRREHGRAEVAVHGEGELD